MLLNNLFHLHNQQINEHSLLAKLSVDPAHAIFEGHFPGQPVVPGVCMVQVVKELVESATGQQLLLQKAAQIKFLRLWVPEQNQIVSVTVSWQIDGNNINTTAAIQSDTEHLFKISGVLVRA
jgi:3-hydroxyacyl-[acyl-carrier-protein] dehydratase